MQSELQSLRDLLIEESQRKFDGVTVVSEAVRQFCIALMTAGLTISIPAINDAFHNLPSSKPPAETIAHLIRKLLANNSKAQHLPSFLFNKQRGWGRLQMMSMWL